jgi:hypothetical protein
MQWCQATRPQTLKDAPFLLNQVASPPGACVMLMTDHTQGQVVQLDETSTKQNPMYAHCGVAAVTGSPSKAQPGAGAGSSASSVPAHCGDCSTTRTMQQSTCSTGRSSATEACASGTWNSVRLAAEIVWPSALRKLKRPRPGVCRLHGSSRTQATKRGNRPTQPSWPHCKSISGGPQHEGGLCIWQDVRTQGDLAKVAAACDGIHWLAGSMAGSGKGFERRAQALQRQRRCSQSTDAAERVGQSAAGTLAAAQRVWLQPEGSRTQLALAKDSIMLAGCSESRWVAGGRIGTAVVHAPTGQNPGQQHFRTTHGTAAAPEDGST